MPNLWKQIILTSWWPRRTRSWRRRWCLCWDLPRTLPRRMPRPDPSRKAPWGRPSSRGTCPGSGARRSAERKEKRGFKICRQNGRSQFQSWNSVNYYWEQGRFWIFFVIIRDNIQYSTKILVTTSIDLKQNRQKHRNNKAVEVLIGQRKLIYDESSWRRDTKKQMIEAKNRSKVSCCWIEPCPKSGPIFVSECKMRTN